MKHFVFLPLIIGASFLLSSCAERDAREYAHKLAELLASYSQQIDRKLADEEARYVSEAKRDEDAIERDAETGLKTERVNRAMEAAKQLSDGSLKPTDLLETIMPAYARKDFDQSEALYTKAQDAYASHLKSLTQLSIEKTKVEALQQALEGLAKEPNLAARAQEFGKFASDLKDQINLQTCSAAVDTIAARQISIDSLTADINDPSKAAEKEKNQKKLEIAQADQKAAEVLRDGSGKFSDGKCQ